ncbi:MAG: methyltransferase domain-containing protein, partial [Nitrososphaera sp.]|nr:methyltransferase domain-containing protein [Nitrososphaera sp.]
ECFDRMLFATNKLYGENVLKIRKGDLLFLLNLDTDTLYGTFRAKSNGTKDLFPHAWKGRYPYQVEVSRNNNVHSIKDAKKIFSSIGASWHDPLDPDQARLLSEYLENPNGKLPIKKVKNDEKPRLESTTLWDYPRQSYGMTQKGSNKYAGVTPAFVIYNMVWRYTEPGDLVLDPMAGSGTTMDVCNDEGRRCIAYDISPTRPDIVQNDARKIPLGDGSVDMVFVDSPYGDNIDYNDHPANIGKISSESEQFYKALDVVMAECQRVLKPGGTIGWLIGDQWVKKKFTPVGFRIYNQLSNYFDAVDIVCVARRSQTSNTGIWHNRALRFNFYLRGFKYLFIMRKPPQEEGDAKKRKVSWTRYER